MPIYEYSDRLSGYEIGDNPFVFKCLYCKSYLAVTEIQDIWPIRNKQILQVHRDTAETYQEIHDLEECYLDLELDTKHINVMIHYCWNCGWWRLIKNICVCAREHQIWDIKFGCAGALRNLDVTDINVPLQDVRKFLTVNYAKRINVNPRLFEELVADVFRGLGYLAYVTAYSKDGGIDIVLKEANGSTIGVQVKRQKNAIEAEQIRSFVGALLLGDYTSGIYVTTSHYRSGATDAACKSGEKGIAIELLDAKRFYDALNIAQKFQEKIDFLPFIISRESIPKISFYGYDTPKNSL